jgi:hypothetical protein
MTTRPDLRVARMAEIIRTYIFGLEAVSDPGHFLGVGTRIVPTRFRA